MCVCVHGDLWWCYMVFLLLSDLNSLLEFSGFFGSHLGFPWPSELFSAPCAGAERHLQVAGL